jgi:hypothetical protein
MLAIRQKKHQQEQQQAADHPHRTHTSSSTTGRPRVSHTRFRAPSLLRTLFRPLSHPQEELPKLSALSEPESLGTVGVIVLLVVTLLNVFVLAYTVMAALGIDDVQGSPPPPDTHTHTRTRTRTRTRTHTHTHPHPRDTARVSTARLSACCVAVSVTTMWHIFTVSAQRLYRCVAWRTSGPCAHVHIKTSARELTLLCWRGHSRTRSVWFLSCCNTHAGTSSVYVSALFALCGAGIPMYHHATWLVGSGQ